MIMPRQTVPGRASVRPGRVSYEGSVRNGVESHDFAEWHGSFYFQR